MVVIAYLSMIVDHVYKFLAPNLFVANTFFGRLAMPIFAYLLAVGMKRTKSREKYIYRLFIFSIVSQIPYILMIKDITTLKLSGLYTTTQIINVLAFFTQEFNMGFVLLISAIFLQIMEFKENSRINKLITFILTATIITLFDKTGWYTLLLVIMFYYIELKNKEDLKKMVIYMFLITTFYIIVSSLKYKIFKDAFTLYSIQYASLISLPIIYVFKDRGKRNTRMQTFIKYSIYPIHAIIIFIMRMLLFT